MGDAIPAWAKLRRSAWQYRGQERPPFAAEPGQGQESVWDYPRPPRVVTDTRRVIARAGNLVIADTTRALRVLETASAPSFYIPQADVDMDVLEPRSGRSACEWKGVAKYWGLRDMGPFSEVVGWSYPKPLPGFEAIADSLAFYPGRLQCLVDGERVRPQGGGFYGGWVTSEIVGPIKGDPGSQDW